MRGLFRDPCNFAGARAYLCAANARLPPIETPETNAGPVFPCNTTVSIEGPAGPLEAVTQCPRQPRPATAVICHPHPLHGGTLHNKVVYTLARSLVELGLRAVRFNFRGVGASAGTYADAVGETDDATAVLRWVRARRPLDEIWLAGFSFGAYVALRAAARFDVARLIVVAPPVNLYPQQGPPPAPRVPLLVLQGDADDVVLPTGVQRWCERAAPASRLRTFAGAGHFFHGRLNDLRSAIEAELAPAVPAES